MLSGTNSYSGGTNLNGGILAVASDSNLGTGGLTFNGGTLEALTVGGGITSAKAVTLNGGGGTFLSDPGTVSTLSGNDQRRRVTDQERGRLPFYYRIRHLQRWDGY